MSKSTPVKSPAQPTAKAAPAASAASAPQTPKTTPAAPTASTTRTVFFPISSVPRLKTYYLNNRANLQQTLHLKNLHQVPELKKVVVSCGVGQKREDKRFTETVILTLTKITGQIPAPRPAKKSIASFKIRKGMGAPIGYLSTLRNAKMYEFVDRLINVALPRVRDFHGVSRHSFDAQGNYSLGFTEQTVFPEITFEDAAVVHGLEVTFIIKNGSKEGSTKLLELFGLPFEKERN